MSPRPRLFAVHEIHGHRERLVYDATGALAGWINLSTGQVRIFGPPPPPAPSRAALFDGTECAVSRVAGQWVVYDTTGEIGFWADLVPHRWDTSGHLAPCPVIGTELPSWAREVTAALATVDRWRDTLPPWATDELINRSAHQLRTQPVPDNPEMCAATCSCGNWNSLVVTTPAGQQPWFDGHMIGLQIAARPAR